jgi:hypothetical protein
MKKYCFSRSSFSPKSLWQFLIACVLTSGFFAVLVTSCKKQGDDLAPPTAAFEQLAKDFLAKSALPLKLTGLDR